MTKKTVVLGATPNPTRYAFLATNRLIDNGYETIPVGVRKGEIAGINILDLRSYPQVSEVHTITLYVGPRNLIEWEDYILSLKPKRIIFNPGTENPEFAKKAKSQGIETLEACTLVMLSAHNF